MMTDSVWSETIHQASYRSLLQAMARPGTCQPLPACDRPAWLLVAATLLDGAVTIADPNHLLTDEDRTFLQAAPQTTESAMYIIADGSRPPSFSPSLGTLEQPHLGATIIVVVGGIGAGPLSIVASGPGIPEQQHLDLLGLDPAWFSMRALWTRRFPLGVDLVLVDANHVTALPRTTKIDGDW